MSSQRFLIIGSACVIVLLGMASWLIQDRLRKNMQEEVAHSLTAVLDTTHQAVKSWASNHRAVASMAANTPGVRKFVQQVSKLPHTHKALLTSPAQADVRQFLHPLWSGMDYEGFYIVDKSGINIAANWDDYVGHNNILKNQQQFFSKLNDGESAISQPVSPVIGQKSSQDEGQSSPVNMLPDIFSGAPIRNASGKISAYIIFQLSHHNNFAEVLQHGQIGRTGETYAFDRQGRLISDSRFVRQLRESGVLVKDKLANLNIEIRDPGDGLKKIDNYSENINQRPFTTMAESAISGQSGTELEGYRDYRGVYVVGAWLWDKELEIGIATEMDRREAYQSFRNIQYVIYILTGLVIVMIIGLIILRVVYGEKKLAVQEKSDSDAKLRLLLESVGEGVFGVDLEGNCTFVNPTAVRLLGYDDASELVGKNIHPIIHHTKADGTPCPDAECRIYGAFREAKNFYVDDEVLWRADKSCFNVEYRSNPICKNKSITGSVATFTDITSRKQAESALRNSEAKYRQVFNSIADVYAEIGMDGRILEVSPSVKVQTGYSREELLGRFMGDFYANPGDREKLRKIIFRDGVINDYEAILVDKNGIARPYSFTGKVVTDDNNQPVKLAGIMRNITDRKHAENNLRDAHDELERRVQERTVELEVANKELRGEIRERKLVERELRDQRDKTQRYLDTVEAIIVSLDHDGKITLINRKGCELLGYSEHELLGKHWFDTCLPQPDGMETVYAVFREIMNGNLEAAEYYENHVLTRDGARRLIAWHNSYFLDDSGGIVGTISAGEDISDRVLAEEKARQHEAELAHMARLNIMGEMATGMAHELNQPLSAITTYADVASRILAVFDKKNADDKTEKLQLAVTGAKEQAQRAAEIIKHLRQLVSKQTAQKEDVNINQLINDSVNLMKHEIQKHGIELTLELDKDLPLIAADPIQIEQVLINLIRNSLEAIRQAHVMKGKIFIQSVVVNGDNESQIIITDNGPGVGEEDKHRIFDPFVTAKSGEGMGMGLSISRSIIEAHHGKLSVASEPGRGARFSFTLPVDNHLYQ